MKSVEITANDGKQMMIERIFGCAEWMNNYDGLPQFKSSSQMKSGFSLGIAEQMGSSCLDSRTAMNHDYGVRMAESGVGGFALIVGQRCST